MGFRFRYESLLSYRGHLKEKAEIDLGKAQSDLVRARQVLDRDEGLFQEARSALCKGMTGSMSSEDVVTYADYLSGLKKRIAAQRLEVARWERVVAEKRMALLAKSKEYRIIEKLKEKDVQKWDHQALLLEQRKMGEVAVTRFGREFL